MYTAVTPLLSAASRNWLLLLQELGTFARKLCSASTRSCDLNLWKADEDELDCQRQIWELARAEWPVWGSFPGQ